MDEKLFKLLDKKTKERWKKFSKYYLKDSKKFINRISRDYEKAGMFPVHVLKQIKRIDKKKYDSAVCVLRGALPYTILFEADGWKIHYIMCGRRNEEIFKKKRFNMSVDKSLKQIKGNKILIIENNSPTGNTPIIVRDNLRKKLGIKKPDLFLDYFYLNKNKIPKWLKKVGPFWKTKKKLNKFGKIYEASSIKVNNIEKKKLIREFLEKLK